MLILDAWEPLKADGNTKSDFFDTRCGMSAKKHHEKQAEEPQHAAYDTKVINGRE